MGGFRTSKIFRFLWMLMAMHILNISIGTSDLQDAYDLDENVFIDSVTEIILDKLLGEEEDTAQEDTTDTRNQTKEPHVGAEADFFLTRLIIKLNRPAPLYATDTPHEMTYNKRVHTELIVPPPKA